MARKGIFFRLPPELIEKLSETANTYRGFNMTVLVEVAVSHLLSLPKEDRDKLMVHYLMGQVEQESKKTQSPDDSPDS